jgi:hypothetical protein
MGGESLDQAFIRARELDASLGEQLRAFAEAARQRQPHFAEAVDRLVERLRRYGAGDRHRGQATRCRLSSCPMTPVTSSALRS